MAGKASGAKSTGRNRAQARFTVTRARRTRPEQHDAPRGKNLKADVNEHTAARAGQQAPASPTTPGPNTPYPQRGRSQSSAPTVAGRGVRDQSSAATGSSLFEKVDQQNRKLGRRNRRTA
jgi:hypothetical protein